MTYLSRSNELNSLDSRAQEGAASLRQSQDGVLRLALVGHGEHRGCPPNAPGQQQHGLCCHRQPAPALHRVGTWDSAHPSFKFRLRFRTGHLLLHSLLPRCATLSRCQAPKVSQPWAEPLGSLGILSSRFKPTSTAEVSPQASPHRASGVPVGTGTDLTWLEIAPSKVSQEAKSHVQGSKGA